MTTRNHRQYGPRKIPIYDRVISVPMWQIAIVIFIALMCAQIGYKQHEDAVIVHGRTL